MQAQKDEHQHVKPVVNSKWSIGKQHIGPVLCVEGGMIKMVEEQHQKQATSTGFVLCNEDGSHKLADSTEILMHIPPALHNFTAYIGVLLESRGVKQSRYRY